ncbi:hypothetical protein HYPSUDRAFT_860926 [Hypholoma sublateritium FD-334 SS-4]|uniref:Uncharacterized protein n=1 Tax=Hypholoma sublateritium (strain FD-334 SS-4) TaxID=945553 RepID=A0A0D2KYR1_HYPSF|nr:hypothetical protein HYPSUDRAFT_860926 [Hypholoma sublateritium FD-334 SS-4]
MAYHCTTANQPLFSAGYCPAIDSGIKLCIQSSIPRRTPKNGRKPADRYRCHKFASSLRPINCLVGCEQI